jgi:hypothetical protein
MGDREWELWAGKGAMPEPKRRGGPLQTESPNIFKIPANVKASRTIGHRSQARQAADLS